MVVMIMLLVQIGIHYEGIFYEFVPWNGVVNFEVAPWGHWCMSAENGTHTVIGYILVEKKQFSFSPRIISVCNSTSHTLSRDKLSLEAKSLSAYVVLFSLMWLEIQVHESFIKSTLYNFLTR